MTDATVADELAFKSWPDEHQRIARAVLTEEVRDAVERAIWDEQGELDRVRVRLAAISKELKELSSG